MAASPGSMVIRLRSRDGLERVTVPPDATLSLLKSLIVDQLNLSPSDSLTLSLSPSFLLAAPSPSPSDDLLLDDKSALSSLSSLGIRHGSVLYMSVGRERQVAGPAAPVTPAGAFGRHMTVEDMVARQTRVERQEKAHAEGVSLDRDAAFNFQNYVHQTLAFSVRRGGFMYGSVSEEGEVAVDFVYEPPQQGTSDKLVLLRDEEEEKRVDIIASGLGMRRVGFVFSRVESATERNYTMSHMEIRQIAELQAEVDFEYFSTTLVKLENNGEGSMEVHFEAFQLSDQCLKLYKDNWFVDSMETPPNLTRMRDEVILAGKDTFEVDNDFFLVPVKIQDHAGILRTTFPVEHRISPPSEQQLRTHLDRTKGRPFCERISDFHLLLFLSKFLDPNTDLLPLAQAIRTKGTVPDGYQLIIEAL